MISELGRCPIQIRTTAIKYGQHLSVGETNVIRHRLVFCGGMKRLREPIERATEIAK
jgi:hypothetical protein